MSRTILISGSSGFVGSHFVKFFAQNGWQVVGVDLVPPPSPLLKYLRQHLQSDIASSREIQACVKKNKVEAVVHCAAKCLVAESVEKPDLYFDYNVIRAEKFVDAIQNAGINTFLLSSTAAVYGEPQQTPIPEDHPKKPINPYGESKLKFENQLLERNESKNLRLGILRYFNAAGADPDGELQEIHEPETHLIPNILRAAMGKTANVSIFGNDYPTRDGTCERDYVHVWDLADAHLKLLEQLLASRKLGVFNLGTGKGYTVKEVIGEIDSQFGKKTPFSFLPRRPGDPAKLIADASAGQKELQWRPKQSDLKTIIATAKSSMSAV